MSDRTAFLSGQMLCHILIGHTSLYTSRIHKVQDTRVGALIETEDIGQQCCAKQTQLDKCTLWYWTLTGSGTDTNQNSGIGNSGHAIQLCHKPETTTKQNKKNLSKRENFHTIVSYKKKWQLLFLNHKTSRQLITQQKTSKTAIYGRD